MLLERATKNGRAVGEDVYRYIKGRARMTTGHEQKDEESGREVQTAAHRDKIVLDSLVVILGFGLCRSWIVFCLAAPFGQGVHHTANWAYLMFGACAALAVALFLTMHKCRVQQITPQLFWVGGLALGISALLIPLSILWNLVPLLYGGFIIGGAGAGVLQILWGERFAFFEIRFATIVAPAAAIITALFTALSSFSFETGLIGYIVFPALSFVLLFVISKRTDGKILSLQDCLTQWRRDLERQASKTEVGEKGPSTSHTLKTPDTPEEQSGAKAQEKQRPRMSDAAKLMFSIAVFSFLCRVFDYLPLHAPDPFAFFGGSALASLVFVGAVFLLLGVLLKDRFNPMLTYRLSLPLMVAGLIALTLLFETHAAPSVLLINTGYEFFDILAWILFTEIARREGEQPLRVFGFGVACMFVGMAMGLLCSEILHVLMVNGDVQITVIALLSIFSLVVVAFLVIPEGTIQHLVSAISPSNAARSESPEGEKLGEPGGESSTGDIREDTTTASAANAPAARRHEESCSRVATEYHLTPRESEVLVLLAHGRTLSIVARDLVIAKGTARTHIESIYRKLNVHKQQELIDLVEEFSLRRG